MCKGGNEMKQSYELPIWEIILLEESNVVWTSGEMTEITDPLQPDAGGSTDWGEE